MTATETAIQLEAQPALPNEPTTGTIYPGAKAKGAGAALAKAGSSPAALVICSVLSSIIPSRKSILVSIIHDRFISSYANIYWLDVRRGVSN